MRTFNPGVPSPHYTITTRIRQESIGFILEKKENLLQFIWHTQLGREDKRSANKTDID